VNVVSPGPTDTALFGQGKSDEERQRLGQVAASGRPTDMAGVGAFLAGDDARWITRQNVGRDGGIIRVARQPLLRGSV
jgi:3-oxoacyl-[acyl-carrier protein] reductase